MLSNQQLVVSYSAATCLAGDTWPCDDSVGLGDLNAVRNNFGAHAEPGLAGDAYPFGGVDDEAPDQTERVAIAQDFRTAAGGG